MVLNIRDLVSGFYSAHIDKKELESIIADVIKKELPGERIESLKYTETGIEVRTNNSVIEIQIDWEEMIIE